MSLLPLEWCVAHSTWWACWGECLEGLWVCGWLDESLGGRNSLTEVSFGWLGGWVGGEDGKNVLAAPRVVCCSPHLVGMLG
jgi:hypothetical protein